MDGIEQERKRRRRASYDKWRKANIEQVREDNLQVIPATKNISKQNRYWPGMPT